MGNKTKKVEDRNEGEINNKKDKKSKDFKLKEKSNKGKSFYQKGWFLMVLSFVVLLLVVGGVFAYKAGSVLSKISEKDETALSSILGVLPGGNETQQDNDGRLNVLLLGMRGDNMPGGGLLADSIIIASLKPEENKMALISIPRDLYTENPKSKNWAKINSVYFLGEENGGRQGINHMENVVEKVSGIDIHYTVVINFAGFRQLIDAVGGIDIVLETPFYEVNQFVKGKECGGEFILPKGVNHLTGERALCYVRARENTSDFDRARRQQLVLQKLKEKMISLGTLTNFNKINAILEAIGSNVRTNMSSAEMKSLYEKYSSMQDAELFQRVFEDSEEGMLEVLENSPKEVGYVLVPRKGKSDYSDIHRVCREIFEMGSQSNINPVKQYVKPKKSIEKKKSNKKKNKTKKKDDEPKGLKVEVLVEGDLPLKKGLEIDSQELLISEVLVKENEGFSEDEVVIDLDDFDKEKKSGKVKFKIEDLEDLEDFKVISHDDDDIVLEIEIEKD